MPAKLQRVDNVFSAPLDDSLLMMNAEKGRYFEARGAGRRIWELLAEPITVDALAAALLDEFDVSPQACAEQTAAFVQALRDNGMVIDISDEMPCT